MGTDGWLWLAGGVVLVAGLVAWLAARMRRVRARRRRLAQGFSPAEEAVLDRNFPRWRWIPGALRDSFAGIVRVLMEEKSYEPCGGLPEVTDEMRLTIAAQAAILLIGLPDHGFFPGLRSVLVYPGAFRDPGRRRFDLELGDDRGTLYGESWESGSVVLSWDNVVAGGQGIDDGMNVVVHEFAHQLDQYNGVADGLPQLRSRDDYRRWKTVMEAHYELLQEQSADRRGREPFLDPYGATDPAEFFAVVSETFFEDPLDLEEEHPELYEVLADYYGVDPAGWQPEEAPQ
ncbi:MAG TPA: M90 family metallopeptidase [Bacteroidia bacterium]|nr:M90 family metallopeptidase [Bacteroidia bacterium]